MFALYNSPYFHSFHGITGIKSTHHSSITLKRELVQTLELDQYGKKTFGEYCNKFSAKYTLVIYTDLLICFLKAAVLNLCSWNFIWKSNPANSRINMFAWVSEPECVWGFVDFGNDFGRKDKNPPTLFVAAGGGWNGTLCTQCSHCIQKYEWGPHGWRDIW